MALVLSVLLAPSLARADEPPFQGDANSHWMSFDRYKDTGSKKDVGASDEGDVIDFPKLDAELPPAPVSPATPTVPIVASPKRPIDLPILPALNKGFDVKVNSTDEDYVPPPISAKDATAASAIPLSEKKWADPNVTATSRKADNSEDDAPLNVRATFLPNQKITPIPSPDHLSASVLSHAMIKKPVVKKDQKQPSAEDAAACAAIDAYKKQQLDAIQGDRQTLQALQEAIKSLGLQKQLGFIAGGSSSLSTPMPQYPADIDIPMSTPTK